MSDAPVPVPAFNEATIRDAITTARGDLFVAAEMLKVTLRHLDRAIRASRELQLVFLTVQQVKASAEYDSATKDQLEAEIARRLTMYRADALEALHELATAPAPDAGYAQVKLAAATRLIGSTGENTVGAELGETLRVLNEKYHAEAPRIRVHRETIEISAGRREAIDVTPAETP